MTDARYGSGGDSNPLDRSAASSLVIGGFKEHPLSTQKAFSEVRVEEAAASSQKPGPSWSIP